MLRSERESRPGSGLEYREIILLRLTFGDVVFIQGSIFLKIPNEYFVGTGIGTGFHQVRDDRDRGEKTPIPPDSNGRT